MKTKSMSHSKTQVWIHVILGVKFRYRLIRTDVEVIIHQMILNEFRKQKCFVEAIGGVEDHIHVLFWIKPSLSLSQVMRQVKGAVSFRINNERIIDEVFRWQEGYGAFSVSESLLGKKKRYILGQKEHHGRGKDGKQVGSYYSSRKRSPGLLSWVKKGIDQSL